MSGWGDGLDRGPRGPQRRLAGIDANEVILLREMRRCFSFENILVLCPISHLRVTFVDPVVGGFDIVISQHDESCP